jgi:outer membrane protein
MKALLKSLVVIGIVTASSVSFAQKTAYIDLDSILSIMPEMAKAKDSSAFFYKQLESQLTFMQKDLNDKLADYQTHEKEYIDIIKQQKQKDLQDLNQRIQDFQVQAQTSFQKKNDDLTKPINDKAKKAIAKVAKAKGFKLVIDASAGTLLYSEPSEDIFNLVKAELGIKDAPVAPKAPGK